MLTDIVVRVRCIVSIFGIIVACLACVACGTERQDAVPSPSQTTAKAEDGTEFTGAYARRFADTYDNLQTGCPQPHQRRQNQREGHRSVGK